MAACPKCGGAMLTERPGDHRCPSAASEVISVISPSEEPPIVNVRIEFHEAKGPTAKLWVTGRPLEAADWEAAKSAIDSVISVHDIEFFTPAPTPEGPRVPRGGILG